MTSSADSADESQRRATWLKELFREVDPIEITGIDLTGKSAQEITRLLPRFTTVQQERGNPAFGIFIEAKTGRAWGLRSGFSPDVVEIHKGIQFKTGTMTKETAMTAGGAWTQRDNPLAAHLEGQAAAFMRKTGITDGILYTNVRTPCRGLNRNGCLFRLPELLAEGANLTVFNKNGRPFSFTGLRD